MTASRDLSDLRFERLTVTERSASRARDRMWRCRCDCGRDAVVAAHQLTSGNTKSCGCLRRPHGHWANGKASPTYSSWCALLARCLRPGSPGYEEYGGRGISVCERWRDFTAFLADMGERPAATTIDRIDNAKGYEPGNCRWATAEVQQGNRCIAHILTFQGRSSTIAEWARQTGLGGSTIRERLQRGWSVEDALTIPPASLGERTPRRAAADAAKIGRPRSRAGREASNAR